LVKDALERVAILCGGASEAAAVYTPQPAGPNMKSPPARQTAPRRQRLLRGERGGLTVLQWLQKPAAEHEQCDPERTNANRTPSGVMMRKAL
jgi:hypothetical protein